jgi:hypothetical protein
MIFDPGHLRIAAQVRTKALRQRWFSLAGVLILLLIMAVGVVWAIVAVVRAALLMAF